MEGPAAVRVRINDPAKVKELESFLGRCGCAVSVVGEDVVEVRVEATRIDPTRWQPERELDTYLRVWSAIAPDAAAARDERSHPAAT